jgi:hypothetical protein
MAMDSSFADLNSFFEKSLLTAFSALLISFFYVVPSSAEVIPANKGSKYFFKVFEYSRELKNVSLPKLMVVYPEGKSRKYLSTADNYSAQFSRKGYLTKVTSSRNLRSKIKGKDILLVLSSGIDKSKYISYAKENSILTISASAEPVRTGKASPGLIRQENGSLKLVINRSLYVSQGYDFRSPVLKFAKVYK